MERRQPSQPESPTETYLDQGHHLVVVVGKRLICMRIVWVFNSQFNLNTNLKKRVSNQNN